MEQEGDHDADLERLRRERAELSVLGCGALQSAVSATASSRWAPGSAPSPARYEQGREVVANDVSAACVRALRERFADHPNVRVEDRDLRTLELDERFDSVLMVNVLEHIADDVEALRGLSRLLVPGGNVVVYVPALNGLYGALDQKIGHYRRYSVWRLREVFREAGLEPVELRWVNFVAIPAWAAFGRGDVNDPQRSSKLLSLWDRTAVPAARFVEAHVRTPIGLNVLGVGRRLA